MRLTLTLTREATDGTEPPRTFVFEQPVVRFGRAEDNDLTVEDASLVVSKRHGLIRVEEGELLVEDLGSKNYTFVNEQRLTAGQPRALRPGDRVAFGPFTLEARLDTAAPTPARDLEQTVFAPSFANPFAAQAEALAEALGAFRRSVFTSSHPRRDEAAAEALRDAFGPGGEAEAVHALLRGEPVAPPTPAAPSVPEADTGLRAPYTPARSSDEEDDTAPRRAPAEQAALPDDVALRLMRIVTRLVGIPAQFKHEFIGHTILHAPETAFLYDGDANALWRYLTDAPDREERLRLLEEAAEEVVRHQMAMLAGYRAAAENGSGALLDAVTPEALDAEEQGGAVGRLLSAVRGDVLADRLRARLDELRAERVSVLERRYFRPAFIDAYLAQVAARSGPAEPDARTEGLPPLSEDFARPNR